MATADTLNASSYSPEETRLLPAPIVEEPVLETDFEDFNDGQLYIKSLNFRVREESSLRQLEAKMHREINNYNESDSEKITCINESDSEKLIVLIKITLKRIMHLLKNMNLEKVALTRRIQR